MMIDDLDMPNESMTISQLSQSQWQGKSGRSFISNLTSHQGNPSALESNDILNSGRSPHPDGTGMDDLISQTLISKTDLNNFNASLGTNSEIDIAQMELGSVEHGRS